jgi:regulator of RNase E activity RraA
MSRQVIKTMLFLAGAVLFVSAIALAEKAKIINIYTDSVLPSGQELKSGKYQVDVNAASNQVTFKKGDKVVATSECQIVEKPQKNACSEARFGQKNNKQELQEIRFGGENRSILLIHGGS